MSVIQFLNNNCSGVFDITTFSLVDPLSIGSLALSGLGSLFGGLFGKSGQDKANETNLQIARETNQANRENQEYQNQWNLNMWNKQNEYNSPSAQRQRLDAAGINPIYAGLDGNGNAGALQSAPFEAVNGAPMANSGQFMGESLMNATRNMAEIQLIQSEAKKNDAETKGVNIGNEILQAKKPTIIENENVQLQINKGILDMQESQKEELSKNISLLDENIKNAKKQRDVLQATHDSIVSQNDADVKLKNAKTEEIYERIAQKYLELILEERKVVIDELMYWPEVQEILSRIDLSEQQLFELKSTMLQRFDEYNQRAKQRGAQIDNINSSTAVNMANAKYIGKKGDYYEYELIIDGVKCILLAASAMTKK